MSNEYIISVKNLKKVFNKTFYALDDVSLNIKKGEFVVILGASGDGKSTLLNIIGAMDKPTSGSVYFNDTDISLLSEGKLTEYRKKNIGYIFQSFNLINDITVYENVMLQASILKDHLDPISVLDMVGLKDKADSYPKELSGGQQQRVAIARALVKNSDIILCDEPTGALDYKIGKTVLKSIEDLRGKKTIIFVTHTKEIAKMADHVVVMEGGKIKEEYYNTDILSSDLIEW